MWDDGKAEVATVTASNGDNMAELTPDEAKMVASGIHTLGLGSSRLAARVVVNAETRGRERESIAQSCAPTQAHETRQQAQANTSKPEAAAAAAGAGPTLDDEPLRQARDGGAASPTGRIGDASWFVRRTGRSRSPPRSESTRSRRGPPSRSPPPKEAVEGGPSGTVYSKGYNDDELWTGKAT